MEGKTLPLRKEPASFMEQNPSLTMGRQGEERRLFFLIIHSLQSRQWAEHVPPRKLRILALFWHAW